MSLADRPQRRIARRRKKSVADARRALGPHVRNLAGVHVGTLIVEDYVRTHRQGASGRLQMAQWQCRCTECGHVQVKSRRAIALGKARCDQCHRKVRKDLLGKRFGRLKVTALSPIKGDGKEARWVCVCECGEERTYPGRYLLSGDTRSCGCLRREASSARASAMNDA